MTRPPVRAAVMALLVGILAACGGGGDATLTETAAPAQTATATAAAVAPTATSEPSPTATATAPPSPTREPTRTPAPAPTRLLPTATPPPAPTATATPEAGATVAQLLGFAALSEDDLGGDWTLNSSEVPDLSEGPSVGFCGQPHFPGREERVGALDVELARDDGQAIVLQGLVAYPYSTAYDAMEYALEISATCDEWVADDGTVISATPLDDPGLGDESFAMLLSFDINGTALDAYNVYVREDEYLMALSYVVAAGGDASPLTGIAQMATAKMFAISEWFFHPEFDPDFLAQSGALLLTTPELPGEWTLVEHAIPTADDRYGICNATALPDEYVARSEIGVRFHMHPEDGPYVTHALVALDDASVATDAMSHIRDSTGCADWTDDGGDYYIVVDRPAVELGDESYAVVIQGEDPEVGTVQVGALFVRTGSLITVVLLAQIGEADMEQALQIAQLALAKLGR